MSVQAIPQPPAGFLGEAVRVFFGGRDSDVGEQFAAGHFGVAEKNVVFPVQRHTSRAAWVKDHRDLDSEPVDGVVTDVPGLVLGVRTADCVPILLSDPGRGVVAAVHAGWRGTAGGIVRRTLDLMEARAGTRMEDVRMAVGPAIGPCCYEVGAEVLRALGHGTGSGKGFVDLAAVNECQSRDAGVAPAHIWHAGICTKCGGGLLHSFRRDGGRSGRQVSLILLAG